MDTMNIMLQQIRSLPIFTANDGCDIYKFIEEVERKTILYGWTVRQEYVIAKKRMRGTAALWLRTESDVLSSWQELKSALLREFGDIHDETPEIHAIQTDRLAEEAFILKHDVHISTEAVICIETSSEETKLRIETGEKQSTDDMPCQTADTVKTEYECCKSKKNYYADIADCVIAENNDDDMNDERQKYTGLNIIRHNGRDGRKLQTFWSEQHDDDYAGTDGGGLWILEFLDGGVRILGSDEAQRGVVSILDWLNEDHWWLVLDYVPVKDIIRSERVSKRWQGVVHHYLQEVGICVAYLRGWFAQRNVKRHPKNRIIAPENRGSYVNPTKQSTDVLFRIHEKWGSYMVYTYCTSRLELESIVRRCPNLKGLAIHMDTFGSGPLSQKEVELCEKLEQLALIHYTHYYDLKLMDDDERLFCYKKPEINSAFWPNLNPANLRCLTVCGMFDFKHFLAAIDCFPKLTELNVQGYHSNTLQLLEKTPKLKRLALLETSIDLGSAKFKLDHLEDLLLYEFWGAKSAKWLESLADRELRSLTFICVDDDVQKIGLKLMKTRWRMLNKIVIQGWGTLSDDDAVAIVNNCQRLTLLDLRGCEDLTLDFVARAARARLCGEAPLLLKLRGSGWGAIDGIDTFDQSLELIDYDNLASRRPSVALGPAAAAAVRKRKVPVRLRLSAADAASNQIECPGLIVDTTGHEMNIRSYRPPQYIV